MPKADNGPNTPAIEPQLTPDASRRAALVGAVGFAAAIAMPSANAATSVQHSAQLLRAKILWETHWAAYRPLEEIEDAREYERLHAEIAAENKPRWTEYSAIRSSLIASRKMSLTRLVDLGAMQRWELWDDGSKHSEELDSEILSIIEAMEGANA